MTISRDELSLPEEIGRLIDGGVWPDHMSGKSAEIYRRISKKSLSDLIPDESDIYFYPPPFRSVQDEIDLGSSYWLRPESAAHQIDARKVLVIGDFGHGSDTTLALDYSYSSCPSVIKLQWVDENPAVNNRWVKVCDSFGEFCHFLGILRI